MLIAYVDESGNTGDVAGGGSLTYTLGCVLVEAGHWPHAFEQLIDLRRRIRDRWGLPMRAEVKASYLVRNSGPFAALAVSPAERQLIYRAHLSTLDRLPARAFAVVVDKRNGGGDYFNLAWEGLLQRLERTSTYEKMPLMVMHDEGEDARVRTWVRQARRHLTAGNAYGPGGTRNPIRLLVDDPVPKRSQQSYLIQVADLVAYAAFRSFIPPGPNVALVCPQGTWGAIAGATHTKVNAVRPRAAPGIVVR